MSTRTEALEATLELRATLRQRVVALFAEYGPMTDEDLYDVYRATYYSPDIQRTSLIAERNRLGATDTEVRQVNRSGRRAIVWDLV